MISILKYFHKTTNTCDLTRNIIYLYGILVQIVAYAALFTA